ncbi:MAG: DUF5652 family protein [Patescibacteria group bacterium]|mgnify:CR=1 FL=1
MNFFQGQLTNQELLVLGLLILWTIPWKGLALWKAARLGKKYWFIAFLLVHTVGILEILYLFVFSKKQASEGEAPTTNA